MLRTVRTTTSIAAATVLAVTLLGSGGTTGSATGSTTGGQGADAVSATKEWKAPRPNVVLATKEWKVASPVTPPGRTKEW
jgi:hypothetical protein